MEISLVLTLANLALDAYKQLQPAIAEAVRRGEISVEDQAALLAKYESLRTKSSGQFSGPEWAQDDGK